MKFRISAAIAALLSLGTVACGASGVPDIRAQHLPTPALPGVEPRSATLTVVNKRSPKHEGSAETVSRVNSAVSEVLEKSGVSLTDDFPNDLTITLGLPDKAPSGFSGRERCIRVEAHLALPDGAFAEASMIACYEWRHWLGFTMPIDTSDSFRMAVSGALEGLDEQLVRIPRN